MHICPDELFIMKELYENSMLWAHLALLHIRVRVAEVLKRA